MKFNAALQDIDLAYLAGLIDGEGCLSISRVGNYGYGASIIIKMTNEEVIKWVHINFGGCLSKESRKAPQETIYSWQLNTRAEILNLLRALQPYLKVKKVNAKVVAGFCLRFPDARRLGVVKEDISEKYKYYKVAQALNSRGQGSNELKASLAAVL